jgi:hypothetical protein
MEGDPPVTISENKSELNQKLAFINKPNIIQTEALIILKKDDY